MNDNPTQLLHDSLAAEARGMFFLAAAKARRAAQILQGYADRLQHEAVCLKVVQPKIDFEPCDPPDEEHHFGELVIDDLPAWLRRQAE